jgi:cation diffusion facilitator family transporter
MEPADEKIAAARLSVYSNGFLVALKLAVGLGMSSIGVISEGLHSGIDLVAAAIARYSVKKSSEPADDDHMYGHGKFENLSGMIEGTLIFAAAAGIIYEAFTRLVDKKAVEFLEAGMVVMAISAGLNYYVARRLWAVAEKTESLALEADAYHHETDVWTSLGVFAALALISITKEEMIDPVIGLVVAAFIIYAAYDITRRSTEGLLDISLPDHEIKAIEKIMNAHSKDFVNFHRLRARRTGSERQIDLHVTVPKLLSVKEGHDLASHLEYEIRKELPGSVIIIHIEPCKEDCEKCKLYNADKTVFTGKSKE